MAPWQDLPAKDSLPAYSVFMGQIQKPDLDDRDYKLIQLENGLRAILVHDSAADKAAACVTVAVGSMQDPHDVQGLAHFCEHMLSKGSILYPQEEDFMSFISANGGIRNAGTAPTYTNYWFTIGPTFLSGGLARTAAFFHSPLLTQSLTAREIRAVDSEYKRNAQNDSRRILQINKTLSAPGHPWSQFSTGNLESITDAARKLVKEGQLFVDEEGEDSTVYRETRKRLVEWWNQQYCAGRMTLAVIGRESLDELSKIVVSLFSPIMYRGLDPRPIIMEPAWGQAEMGSIIFIKTVKDYHAFSLTFLLPDQRPFYKTKPAEIIAHFLGHEGPGSVYVYLKKKGWLVSLSAGPNSRNRSIQMFKVDGRLTKEGYVHYRDVFLVIFNYLSILRSSRLALYHFKEIRTMSAIKFRFLEKTQPHTYANLLSFRLSEQYPPEQVLSGASLISEWDEDLVHETLKVLVPERGRMTLEARDHDINVIGKDVQWDTERWYGAQYCVQRLDMSLPGDGQTSNENMNLCLPGPNPFIPTNLTVEKQDKSVPEKFPACVRRTSMLTLWYKKDDQFWVPKAHVIVDIRSSLAYGTPRQATMTRLLADLTEDALSEMTYDAALAGLACSVTNHTHGLLISVSGYNDKLPLLLQTALTKLRDLVVDPGRLKVIAEQVRLGYENHYFDQPSNLSEVFASWLLMPMIWTPADKLAEISSISEDDIERHKNALLAKVHIEVLVNGNIDKNDAIALAASVETTFDSRALPCGEHARDRSLIVLHGANFVARKIHANPKETNSSLTYYCQFGEITDNSLRSALAFIAHAIKEPCFTQLRTKEQLGYVVASSMWTVASSMGLGIKVQSERAPWDVEKRVDAFLEQFQMVLVNMSTEDFEAKKEGLVTKKLEGVKNLREETARFWAHISSGYYDFLQHETDAIGIRALKLKEVVDIFDRLVSPSSGSASRKKISVHLISQQIVEMPPATEATVVTDDSESLFKDSLTCYPAAVPVPSEASDISSLLDDL
ncbi:hypothetical protein AcW1_007154 [Taiwanofungus camphoratus]|nr:hypothetical protein AcW1_007154 [Antrodia cinnamomea]